MPYEFLEKIATGDVAFSAEGETLEEMFAAAAEATMQVMVEDIQTLEQKQEVAIQLENDEIDMLLFDFLQELIYYKDAEFLLLRIHSVTIDPSDQIYRLRAKAAGEAADPEKHSLVVDVKAVTLHQFEVKQTDSGWSARVILDI